MKNKFPLILFLGLAIIYLITCFIGPKDIFKVEHELILDANVENLFNKVNNLEHWNTWNDWLENAKEGELSYSRNLSGKGAQLKFDLDTGEGELEILESERNKRVKTRTIFKSWKGSVYSEYTFKSIDRNKTQINLKVKNSQTTPFIVRGIFFLNKSKKNIEKSTYDALKMLESSTSGKRAMSNF